VSAPASWPGLTLGEVQPILAQYAGLGGVRGVIWHTPLPYAASGLIACEAATVFVKRHDARVRSQADLREEHAFMAHLLRHGATVPRVLPARYGETAPVLRGHTFEVQALPKLADPYRDAAGASPFASLAQARAAGGALARLHDAAAGFSAPPRRATLLVAAWQVFAAADPMAALSNRVAAEPLLAAALADLPWQDGMARVLLPFHAALAPLLPALPPLWTHNDFRAGNLLFTGAGNDVAAVLDFGLANRTTAMFDLATAITRNAVAWRPPPHTATAHCDIARAIVDGYAAQRRPSSGEARALPHLLPLAHADFALSELAWWHGIAGSKPERDAAFHDFLLGHAAWFNTAEGRELKKAVLF
jgi:Ser/Thr protein kinase RdoA (MazF antagonist)